MKKLIIPMLWLICCFNILPLYSQVTYTGLDKDYTQRMDEILINVNKTPITTGILYDRIMSFSNLDWLKQNGAVTNSNYQHFIQSWSELYRSSYNPTFSSLETLKSNINANTNQTLVDIGIINTKMNYIDYGTATTPSLTTSNGLLFNVNGINPFLEKQVTVIAPLKDKITASTITFRLLPSFILQLTGLPIKNLVANFGTGTNYNLISNSVVSTTNPTIIYTTSGKKEFIFTVTYSNNTTEILKATMDITIPNSSPLAMAMASTSSFSLEEDFVGSAGITASTSGNVAFQGYNETTATKGTLEYRTYYNLVTNNGSAQSKIKKEIIILDGYDPGDGRKIYPQSAGYNQENSSLYELMYYDHDNNPATLKENLVEKLRNAPYGFDVTLVNFPAGADYIERNAMAVVSLLQRETAKLTANGSTEKITIIGPSMGGLISRYALAYMEKNNINHNTRLWVSFDSPHLGANIPIGAQENLYFYGYNGRQDQAKIKFDENFRSPAARQMLIEQLDNKHEAFPYPTTLWGNNSPSGQNNNTPFRQQFQTNLNSNGLTGSNGYPQNLRKIALINGTTNGSTTNSAGNKFLELAAFTIIKYGQIFGTPIQTKIKVATINDSFLQNTGGNGQTFSGKVTIKRVRGIEVQNGSVTRINSNPRGCMDIVQGGTFNTQGIIKDEFTLALNDAVDSQEWRTYLPNHAFIPTVSSLAFKNPNFNWSTALNRNLVCDPANKEIYFDTYFAPSKNEEHVFVSAENANWLIKELQGIPQAPYFPIQDNLLTGPAIVCLDSNSTFVIDDICKVPSPVTWEVTPNLQIISQDSYNIVVKGLSNGHGKITAVFTNGLRFEKEIEVGIDPNHFNTTTLNGEDYICGFQSYTYNLNNAISHPCVNSINWSVSPNLSIISQDFNSVTVVKNSFDNQYAGIISASIPNSNIQINKGVWVGVPNSNDLTIQKLGAYDFYVGTWTKLKASYNSLIYPENGAYNLTYEWQIPYSLVRNYDDSAFKDVKPNYGGQLNIGVRACNPCGCSDYKYQLFTVGGATGPNELTPIGRQ
ncbi:esterase/lipase family protein [Flavobacterium sp.]|uniref:esterase/lipase family protein n=4 Tax=Flavobacterium sp. TaxID=239 RepID=UPI004048364C